MVSFNAPHAPFHDPPPELHSYDLGAEATDVDRFAAAVEALDTEMGRLLASIPADVRERTSVIFLSDNGSPQSVITAPFAPTRAKNTPFEGGIHVPMIVTGPLVTSPGTRTGALVHVVDILPTMAHIAGVRLGDVTKPDMLGVVAPVTYDGQSLVRYLEDPNQDSVRDAIYMEQIAPNGGPDYTTQNVAIGRNGRWKLISYTDHDEFYDLQAAVYDEGPDLLPGLGPAQQIGYDQLRAFTSATKQSLPYEGPPRP